MDSLSKYLWSAAALSSVLFLSWESGADWLVAAGTPQAGRADSVTPRWKAERLAPDPQIAQLPADAMSPIYPATPGKELLGKVPPAPRIVRERRQTASAVKPAENPVRQAMRTNSLPRQIYAARAADDPRQALDYAPEPQPQSRRLINFAHEVY
jgi:hypothetical protein